MTYLFVDVFAVILIVAGLVIAFGKFGSRSGATSVPGRDNPAIYVRRIGGIMMAAFGLALAVMFTTFHFA